MMPACGAAVEGAQAAWYLTRPLDTAGQRACRALAGLGMRRAMSAADPNDVNLMAGLGLPLGTRVALAEALDHPAARDLRVRHRLPAMSGLHFRDDDYLFCFESERAYADEPLEDLVRAGEAVRFKFALYAVARLEHRTDGVLVHHRRLRHDEDVEAFHANEWNAEGIDEHAISSTEFELACPRRMDGNEDLLEIILHDNNMKWLFLLNALRQGVCEEAERDVPATRAATAWCCCCVCPGILRHCGEARAPGVCDCRAGGAPRSRQPEYAVGARLAVDAP